MPGTWELIIILAIVILIFGGKRLKGLGSDLGSAIKGFKSSMNHDEKKQDKADVEPEIIDNNKKDA